MCFHNTPSEFPNTPRCVVVTHLFTVLFHSSRKHTIVCNETHKVCKNYTPLCLSTPLDQFATHRKLMRCKALWLEKIICQSYPNTPFNGNTPWMFEDIFNSCIITITFTEVNLTHFRSISTTQPKSPINLLIRAYIPVTHASLSKLFVPSARIAQDTMLSCTRVCP